MISLKKIFSAIAVFLIFTSLTIDVNPQTKIALLYSNYSEAANAKNPDKVLEEITLWELFLMQQNISYKVIYDADIEEGIDDEIDILILPNVDILSNEELEELHNFLSSGNSILSIGSKLNLYGHIAPSTQNLEYLFGITSLKIDSSDIINYQHSIIKNKLNHFNTAKTGLIQISNKDKIIYSNKNLEKDNTAGYLIDRFDQQPRTSIIFGNKNSGKFLWTGFGLSNVTGGELDLDKFKNLIIDALNWMDYNIDVFIDYKHQSIKKNAILILQNNNALDIQLIKFLSKNDFFPHISTNIDQKLPEAINQIQISDFLIVDLTNKPELFNNFNMLNDSILEYEKQNSLKIISVIVDEKFVSERLLNKLNDIGIKNIFVNSFINKETEIGKDDQVLFPFTKKLLNNLTEAYIIFHTPRFNCDENDAEKILFELNKFKNENYDFDYVENIRNKILKNHNLSLKNNLISEYKSEFILTNKNKFEVRNIPVSIILPSLDSRKSITILVNNIKTDYNFTQNLNEITVMIDQLFAESDKKITIIYKDE